MAVEGSSSGGGGKGTVAMVAAMPVVGIAGGTSLLLSSLRLALLARSRLLLPEWCAWAWVVASPAAVVRNQRETSSVLPSVSKTSLAGKPPLLQCTHAMYWLCALGGGRGGRARVWSPYSPVLDPLLAASAHVGEGEG